MPAERATIEAFEHFLKEKKLPPADSLVRSAEGGLPLDPDQVDVIEPVELSGPGLESVRPEETNELAQTRRRRRLAGLAARVGLGD